MSMLAAKDAYRLWAPTYSADNAVTDIEQRLADAMTPPLAGQRLLDAGCGTGRRLQDRDFESAVGVDLSPEMLAAAPDLPSTVRLKVGDLLDLPVEDAAFDVVWCRLAIGHVPQMATAYGELARAVRPGGRVVVTDFHHEAYAAGHRRTFRADGALHEVEHHVHPPDDQIAAGMAVGLRLTDQREGRIGPASQPFYTAAGRPALFEAHLGLAVVLALAFDRAF